MCPVLAHSPFFSCNGKEQDAGAAPGETARSRKLHADTPIQGAAVPVWVPACRGRSRFSALSRRQPGPIPAAHMPSTTEFILMPSSCRCTQNNSDSHNIVRNRPPSSRPPSPLQETWLQKIRHPQDTAGLFDAVRRDSRFSNRSQACSSPGRPRACAGSHTGLCALVACSGCRQAPPGARCAGWGLLQFPRWSLGCSAFPAAAVPCTPPYWWSWSLPARGTDSLATASTRVGHGRKNDHGGLEEGLLNVHLLSAVTIHLAATPVPASLCRPVCRAHQRPAAVQPQQLGASARRLLPHQRQSRRALHVVNYVTEHAPVAYKELTVGECCTTANNPSRLIGWFGVRLTFACAGRRCAQGGGRP